MHCSKKKKVAVVNSDSQNTATKSKPDDAFIAPHQTANNTSFSTAFQPTHAHRAI